MYLAFILTGLTFFVLEQFQFARSECTKYIAGHEIIQAPDSIHVFEDEGGLREIQGLTYDIGKCTPNSRLMTGAQYVGNFTFIGHTNDISTDECVIRKDGERFIYESFQAIVFTLNGWDFKPRVNLDDIDSQQNTSSSNGWKESMAAFGISNGKVVQPLTELYNNTLLEVKEYTVPASATKAMDLDIGEVVATGAQYGSATEMVNCPFGQQYEQSKRCRLSVTFSERIDTLVIMYALLQKSKSDSSAAAFFSELIMDCGCRCREVDVGARMITLPTDVSGECYQRQSTGLKTECDLEGVKWCSVENKIEYTIAGSRLGDGNYPCEELNGTQVTVIGDFSPRLDFVRNMI